MAAPGSRADPRSPSLVISLIARLPVFVWVASRDARMTFFGRKNRHPPLPSIGAVQRSISQSLARARHGPILFVSWHGPSPSSPLDPLAAKR